MKGHFGGDIVVFSERNWEVFDWNLIYLQSKLFAGQVIKREEDRRDYIREVRYRGILTDIVKTADAVNGRYGLVYEQEVVLSDEVPGVKLFGDVESVAICKGRIRDSAKRYNSNWYVFLPGFGIHDLPYPGKKILRIDGDSIEEEPFVSDLEREIQRELPGYRLPPQLLETLFAPCIFSLKMLYMQNRQIHSEQK